MDAVNFSAFFSNTHMSREVWTYLFIVLGIAVLYRIIRWAVMRPPKEKK